MSTTETKVRYTPGPWRAAPPLGEGDYAVLSDKVTAYGNFYVAVISNGEHAEAAGNAALCAAAPDMLEALEATVSHLQRMIDMDGNHTRPVTTLAKVKAAIQRARAV